MKKQSNCKKGLYCMFVYGNIMMSHGFMVRLFLEKRIKSAEQATDGRSVPNL